MFQITSDYTTEKNDKKKTSSNRYNSIKTTSNNNNKFKAQIKNELNKQNEQGKKTQSHSSQAESFFSLLYLKPIGISKICI